MERWHQQGLRRVERVLEGRHQRILVAQRGLVDFCGNHYLGIESHPDVIGAMQDSAARWGAGAGASRLITGTTEEHRGLEEDIAAWKGTDDAVLFATGMQANTAAIPVLARDHIVADALNHASLIDGCRLSKARRTIVPHGDIDAVAQALTPGALFVTDGVFSMDGDVASLRRLRELCTDKDAALYVDDAHGGGVLGDEGAGSPHHAGIRPDVHMGTLSKAIGVQGGFLAADQEVCDHLRNHARGYVFSTAPPVPVVAAARAALDIARAADDARVRLHDNADHLRRGLREMGHAMPDDPTPILPLILGDNDATMRAQAALEAAGMLVTGIRPPTVPQGAARLRITVRADHTRQELDGLLEAVGGL